MKKENKVPIRFTQQGYRLLKNHAFRHAYVFAEYIDNSIQSYKDNEKLLLKENRNYILTISISQQDESIIIEDNAAGITDEKMQTAFVPGSIPQNNKGLNEFGIGLKNASVWMSDLYTVETKAIGENTPKLITFDYHKVINEEIEELNVKYLNPIEKNRSYTKITLSKLRLDVNKFNFDQISKELGSIYRGLLKEGKLKILFLGTTLSYEEPEILNHEYFPDLIDYKSKGGKKPEKIKWRYDFDIKIKNKRVFGFVAILKKMQKNENGISYCRRGRVIQGSGDEKMFPALICSRDASSHQRKRIFGEFNFDEFDVSFDKGKLLDEELIEEFIIKLNNELKSFKPARSKKTYDFLKQARELRVDEDIQTGKIINKLKKKQKASEKTIKEKDVIDKYKNITSKKIKEKKLNITTNKNELIEKIIPGLSNENYKLTYTIDPDISSDSLYDIEIKEVKDKGQKHLTKERINKLITGKININCPFLKKNDSLIKGKAGECFYEFIENLMIAEVIAKIKGDDNAHYVRDTINELLNK